MPPKPQKDNCISIIWDFDGTLTAQDSTTDLIQRLSPKSNMTAFWKEVKKISGVNAPVDSISTSETPAWMHILSEMANRNSIPLGENLNKFVLMAFAKRIKLYPKVFECLEKIKGFSEDSIYKRNNIKIHHFIITAGLQDLVLSIFEYNGNRNLIREIFGCKYHTRKRDKEIINIPIYCMDKTTKTRSLFEINKGCFLPKTKKDVDDLVSYNKEWCHFEDMIYIGDGDTDIPAFSLVKSRGGMTIGVYNPKLEDSKIKKKTEKMKAGKRIDLVTKADFSLNGKLYKAIETKCTQIADRYDSYN